MLPDIPSFNIKKDRFLRWLAGEGFQIAAALSVVALLGAGYIAFTLSGSREQRSEEGMNFAVTTRRPLGNGELPKENMLVSPETLPAEARGARSQEARLRGGGAGKDEADARDEEDRLTDELAQRGQEGEPAVTEAATPAGEGKTPGALGRLPGFQNPSSVSGGGGGPSPAATAGDPRATASADGRAGAVGVGGGGAARSTARTPARPSSKGLPGGASGLGANRKGGAGDMRAEGDRSSQYQDPGGDIGTGGGSNIGLGGVGVGGAGLGGEGGSPSGDVGGGMGGGGGGGNACGTIVGEAQKAVAVANSYRKNVMMAVAREEERLMPALALRVREAILLLKGLDLRVQAHAQAFPEARKPFNDLHEALHGSEGLKASDDSFIGRLLSASAKMNSGLLKIPNRPRECYFAVQFEGESAAFIGQESLRDSIPLSVSVSEDSLTAAKAVKKEFGPIEASLRAQETAEEATQAGAQAGAEGRAERKADRRADRLHAITEKIQKDLEKVGELIPGDLKLDRKRLARMEEQEAQRLAKLKAAAESGRADIASLLSDIDAQYKRYPAKSDRDALKGNIREATQNAGAVVVALGSVHTEPVRSLLTAGERSARALAGVCAAVHDFKAMARADASCAGFVKDRKQRAKQLTEVVKNSIKCRAQMREFCGNDAPDRNDSGIIECLVIREDDLTSCKEFRQGMEELFSSYYFL